MTAPAQLPTTAIQGTQPACVIGSVAPYAECMALVDINAGISASLPHSLAPSDIQAAYHLSSSLGQGHTVAIVDAFDDPNAEADLAASRAIRPASLHQRYWLPFTLTTRGRSVVLATGGASCLQGIVSPHRLTVLHVITSENREQDAATSHRIPLRAHPMPAAELPA